MKRQQEAKEVEEKIRQQETTEVKELKIQAREANEADVSVLLTEVQKLKDDPDKIAEVIGLQGSTFSTEAAAELDTLFQEIHATDNVEEVLRDFVNTAVDTVQKRTGSLLQGRQSWLIHPRDLSVDYNACIGQGAYGKAYKASRQNQVVVVKMFNERQTLEVGLLNDTCAHLLILDMTFVQSKLQEIAVWRNLAHKHILPFLGANVHTRKPYVVSPYCANGNALDYLKKGSNDVIDKFCLVSRFFVNTSPQVLILLF
jgi:hypothetical protein